MKGSLTQAVCRFGLCSCPNKAHDRDEDCFFPWRRRATGPHFAGIGAIVTATTRVENEFGRLVEVKVFEEASVSAGMGPSRIHSLSRAEGVSGSVVGTQEGSDFVGDGRLGLKGPKYQRANESDFAAASVGDEHRTPGRENGQVGP